MPRVQPITEMTIDDKKFLVDSMSEDIRTLVTTYDDWNQEVVNAQVTLNMKTTARDALKGEIVRLVKEQMEQAAAAAAQGADSTLVIDSEKDTEAVTEIVDPLEDGGAA